MNIRNLFLIAMLMVITGAARASTPPLLYICTGTVGVVSEPLTTPPCYGTESYGVPTQTSLVLTRDESTSVFAWVAYSAVPAGRLVYANVLSGTSRWWELKNYQSWFVDMESSVNGAFSGTIAYAYGTDGTGKVQLQNLVNESVTGSFSFAPSGVALIGSSYTSTFYSATGTVEFPGVITIVVPGYSFVFHGTARTSVTMNTHTENPSNLFSLLVQSAAGEGAASGSALIVIPTAAPVATYVNGVAIASTVSISAASAPGSAVDGSVIYFLDPVGNEIGELVFSIATAVAAPAVVTP